MICGYFLMWKRKTIIAYFAGFGIDFHFYVPDRTTSWEMMATPTINHPLGVMSATIAIRVLVST